ncbi:MAG TPA: glycoside hydrolase family 43 protein [Mobilitalea sp.]|nr:glycoside hydrolase family 43 protein [Mobilitalea sp.]
MTLNEINIRDPFVLPYEGKYYMYGTRGATCWGECDGFDVYISDDLTTWSNPIEAFHKPEGFWADRNYWAPEVHRYKGSFYAFVSFKSADRCRGTQILKSNSPIGPFELHSDGPVTPAHWECLDGTFYLDADGQPYMIFCHEWVQVKDGQMCAVKLSLDLKAAISEPFLLFTASEPDWTRGVKNGPNFVTDGPYVYQQDPNSLLLLWSSFSDDGYAQAIARSESGQVDGPWKHDKELLYSKDGGHGMIFRSNEGQLYLTLHTPNETLKEHPVFIRLNAKGDQITVAS